MTEKGKPTEVGQIAINLINEAKADGLDANEPKNPQLRWLLGLPALSLI